MGTEFSASEQKLLDAIITHLNRTRDEEITAGYPGKGVIGLLLLLVGTGLLGAGAYVWRADPLQAALAAVLVSIVPMLLGVYLTVYSWQVDKIEKKTSHKSPEETIRFMREVAEAAGNIAAAQADAQGQISIVDIIEKLGEQARKLLEAAVKSNCERPPV